MGLGWSPIQRVPVVPYPAVKRPGREEDYCTDQAIQGDSFGTRPKKMRISQRLFIRF